MANTNMVLRAKRNGWNLLPDNTQWTNRFEVKSASSNRLYTIAQRKSNGTWGCSCPGWIRHRHCKHLAAVEPMLTTINAKELK